MEAKIGKLRGVRRREGGDWTVGRSERKRSCIGSGGDVVTML